MCKTSAGRWRKRIFLIKQRCSQTPGVPTCNTSGTRETLAIEMGDVSLTALGFGKVTDTRPSTAPTHRRRSNPSRFAPSWFTHTLVGIELRR